MALIRSSIPATSVAAALVLLVFAWLKVGLTSSLIGAIVGEFVGASKGLGYLLDTYADQLEVPQVWAVMVALALLGVVLFGRLSMSTGRSCSGTATAISPRACDRAPDPSLEGEN